MVERAFDNNNSTVKASFENCVSFDNGYNYYFPTFSVSKASDMLGILMVNLRIKYLVV